MEIRKSSLGDMPRMQEIFAAAMEFALQINPTIRIDTHRNNRVMQDLLAKAGFRYCGIIHCWNGDERLAYQLN